MTCAGLLLGGRAVLLCVDMLWTKLSCVCVLLLCCCTPGADVPLRVYKAVAHDGDIFLPTKPLGSSKVRASLCWSMPLLLWADVPTCNNPPPPLCAPLCCTSCRTEVLLSCHCQIPGGRVMGKRALQAPVAGRCHTCPSCPSCQLLPTWQFLTTCQPFLPILPACSPCLMCVSLLYKTARQVQIVVCLPCRRSPQHWPTLSAPAQSTPTGSGTTPSVRQQEQLLLLFDISPPPSLPRPAKPHPRDKTPCCVPADRRSTSKP